jgi:hypothetical protein
LEANIEDCSPRLAWAKNIRSYLKIPKEKKAGGVAQVVNYLSSKYKAVSSNPNTTEQ